MDSWMGPFVVKAGRRLDQFTRNGVKVMGRVFTPRVIYTVRTVSLWLVLAEDQISRD